jgi:hypothetical protein
VSVRQGRSAYPETAVITGLLAFAGNDNSDNAVPVPRCIT